MSVDKQRVPLSPPNSPRMSGTTTHHHDYQWQRHRASIIDRVTGTLPPLRTTLSRQEEIQTTFDDPIRRPLGPHRSFPYSFEHSSRPHHEMYSAQVGATESEEAAVIRPAYHVSETDQLSGIPSAALGGSAHASPTGRLTPSSADDEPAEEPIDDDEEIGIETAEHGEGDQERPHMTAAELRAAKRKMKRFRLTHQQTRFLMNEFSRQPHPDAAHRERLSREIPGLSARQVQVWFQNRRAKLKRLTTDDRERMMRSRALPANFDMTQALHSPFGASAQNMGAPVPSLGSYSAYGESSGIRPLTLETLRGVPDYDAYTTQYANPSTAMSPAIGGFAFTTPPQSVTDTMSPSTAYTFQPHGSPRRPPLGVSGGGIPQEYTAQLPRPSYHDGLSRPTADSVRLPLRSSMSYFALGSSTALGGNQHQDRSFPSQSEDAAARMGSRRRMTGPPPATSNPYGISLNYSQMQPRASSSEQQQRQLTDSAVQANTNLTPYRRSSESLASQPSPSLASYQVPQYGTAQVPHYSQYQNQSYQSPFQYLGRQQSSQEPAHQTSSTFGTMTSQHPFASLGGTAEAGTPENSPGGVPLPTEHQYR